MAEWRQSPASRPEGPASRRHRPRIPLSTPYRPLSSPRPRRRPQFPGDNHEAARSPQDKTQQLGRASHRLLPSCTNHQHSEHRLYAMPDKVINARITKSTSRLALASGDSHFNLVSSKFWKDLTRSPAAICRPESAEAESSSRGCQTQRGSGQEAAVSCTLSVFKAWVAL